MAITVYKFPQPYLELELVEGGSLPINDYYFLGWFQKYSGYYHCSHGPHSEEQSITTSEGYQSIKITWWAYHGDITQFSDAGSGKITVTSTNHNRSNGDEIKIINTTNYNGTYIISDVTEDTFNITSTYNGDDSTGKWLNENNIPDFVVGKNKGGICFKWDNYSMINASTGKAYKWLNMNDPANEGKDEYDEINGHRKWCQEGYEIKYKSGQSQTFTEIGTSYSSLGEGGSFNGMAIGNTQLAFHIGESLRRINPDMFDDLDSKLYIKIDNTDTNNELNDLVDALRNSGYTDNYKIFSYNGWYEIIMIAGGYDGDGEANWNDCTLMTSGGWRCPNIIYNNMQIRYLPLDGFNRSSGENAIQGTYKNTSFFYSAFSMDLYDYLVADGMMPYGNMTFYQNCIGYTFNQGTGGYIERYDYFQFRYPNAGDYKIENVTSNGLYCYVTYSGSRPTKNIEINKLNLNNNGIKTRDFRVAYGYMSDLDCNFVWNCFDVKSDRPDGKVIVYFTQLGSPNSYSDVWYFRYNINVTILDQEGNPLEGCVVTLNGEENSVDTTDAEGKATVSHLGYTLSAPQNVTDGYGITSDWYTSNLTISKENYKTYNLSDIDIREGKYWTISLEKESPEINSVSLVPCSRKDASDGSITINATKGLTPYTYSIDGTTYQSSNLFENLSSDTYTVYVKDSNDLIDSFSGIVLSEPEYYDLNRLSVDLQVPSKSISLQKEEKSITLTKQDKNISLQKPSKTLSLTKQTKNISL